MRRRRPAPFPAEPGARVRVLAAASVQMRSRFNALPKAVTERSAQEIDPARRPNPLAMSSVASAAGGAAGSGGPSGGGAGGWEQYNEA